MYNRHCLSNVAHTFPANFLAGNFHTASVTDNALVPDSFVFSAMAFPVLDRTENPFTEETILLRFVGPVIYGFRFKDLTPGFPEDFLRRSQTDCDLGKIVDY